MNPIPLRHQRRVYAYACGRCHQVYDGGSIRSAILDADSERLYRDRQTGHSKHDAERCCTCSDCGVELPGRRCGRCDPCEAEEMERWTQVRAASRCERDAREAANRAAIAAAGGDVDAALRLQSAMSDLSERCYCAGWLEGCEDTLWAFTQEPGVDHAWGMGCVTAADTEELRRLSDKARGWWRWENGEVFVPLDEWKARATPSPAGASSVA